MPYPTYRESMCRKNRVKERTGRIGQGFWAKALALPRVLALLPAMALPQAMPLLPALARSQQVWVSDPERRGSDPDQTPEQMKPAPAQSEQVRRAVPRGETRGAF